MEFRSWHAPEKLRYLGFSLVEVTIALGLVSFGVLSVIGLLPSGLSTLRQAMDQTVEAQIVQGIASRSVVANFTNLTGVSYFNEEGQSVSQVADARYTATVTTNACVYPGSTNAVNPRSKLVTLRLSLVSAQTTNFYTLQVADTGK